MKHILLKWSFVCVILSIPALVLSAATQPPPVGGVLPEIVLTAPDQVEHQAYLGIRGKKTFTIPDIDARIVIVEIFSMY